MTTLSNPPPSSLAGGARESSGGYILEAAGCLAGGVLASFLLLGILDPVRAALAGAGLLPHVAAGVTVLLVLLLCLLQVGAAAPSYGWIDLVIAVIAGLMVARWMPRGLPASARRGAAR